jgi:hypothetical protein
MNPFLRLPITALCLVGATLPLVSQAAIYSLDITSNSGNTDPFFGAGVFGTAGTVWNERTRISSATSLALVDDTGAESSVTVSYTRGLGSGNSSVAGAFGNLGRSGGTTTGSVVIAGLTAGVSYDLAIYGSVAESATLSYTVGSTTQSINSSLDWSTLTLGTHYTVFQTTADLTGQISFSTTDRWTALQIQPTTAVPEPAESAVALGLASLGAVAWLRSRRQPSAKT